MIEPNLRLQKPLEDYIEYFEALNMRSVALLSHLALPSLSFQDPYHSVRDRDAAEGLLKARLELHENGRYRVHDFAWGRRAETAYIYWTFIFKPTKQFIGKSKKEAINMEGMSEVLFSTDGKVVAHSDFWGAHDDFNVKGYKST